MNQLSEIINSKAVSYIVLTACVLFAANKLLKIGKENGIFPNSEKEVKPQ
jgi:hypothetical protein